MEDLLAQFGFPMFSAGGVDLTNRFDLPAPVKVDFDAEESRILAERRAGGSHGFQAPCEAKSVLESSVSSVSEIKPYKAVSVDAGVQCVRIEHKSPALASTARFFALSARHAALLDEINDLNDEIEYLKEKLREVSTKRRSVRALCTKLLGTKLSLREDLKIYISKDGDFAIKNPLISDEWVYLT